MAQGADGGEGVVRRNLAESDIAAVATFDVNRGIRILANFTEDRAILPMPIDTLGVPTMPRMSDPPACLPTPSPSTSRAVEPEEHGIERRCDPAVLAPRAPDMRKPTATVSAAGVGAHREQGGTGQGMNLVQGRKQLIYFSAGFDHRALVGQTGSESRIPPKRRSRDDIWEVDAFTRYGDSICAR